MKKYNKLLILVILLSFSIINCTDKVQAYKGNKTANSNTYIKDVKKVIENYFIDLESCYDANKFEDMQFEKYFLEYEKNTNCNLNSLYLYSNIEIQKSCGEDLEEKNKKIKFSFGEYKLSNLKEISMNVIIEKNWNYAESPTIDSGSVDKYNVIMDVVNRDKPKIKRIERVDTELTMLEEMSVYDITNLKEENNELNKIKIQKKVAESGKEKIEEENLKGELYESKQILNRTVAQSTYNGTAAATYAQQWALGRNPKYLDFEDLKGDCTNFTSQCLYAGGIPMHIGAPLLNSNWFYQSSSNRSCTWTGADNFRQYITSSSSKISYYDGYFSNVKAGDMIQLVDASKKATHSLIVTGVIINDVTKGRTDVLISCHTKNRKNYSIKNYMGDKVYYRIIGGK